MKTIFTFLLLLLVISSRAQDSLVVTEIQKEFSKGNHPAFTVRMPLVKVKDVKSDWKKYLQLKGNIKVKEDDGEYYLPKTIVKEISNDSIVVYFTIVDNEENVELTGFVGKNDSTFYSGNTNAQVSSDFQAFLRNFAVDQFRNAVKNELSLEQKKFQILEQNLIDLDQDNERFGNKIKANERIIERSEGEIKTNKELQELKSTTIMQQQKVLATYLNESDQRNVEEKKLKALQKEKKKLEKEDEGLHEEIESKEDENKNLKKQIDQNESENIPNKKKEIEKQKIFIQDVESKIKRIQ